MRETPDSIVRTGMLQPWLLALALAFISSPISMVPPPIRQNWMSNTTPVLTELSVNPYLVTRGLV